MALKIALYVKCASHKNKYPSSIGYNRNTLPNIDLPFKRANVFIGKCETFSSPLK